MNTVILGPPGSGKGTQSELIAKEFGIAHISAGDVIRSEISRKTALGKKMEKIVSGGDILPLGMVEKILFPRLRKRDCFRGFVLDGYPRTLAQARLLEKELVRTKRRLSAAILLLVPSKTVIKRLSFRVQCPECRAIYSLSAKPPKKKGVCDKCGSKLAKRKDDNPSSIRERLREYSLLTKPVISFYEKKGLLKKIDADPLEEDSRKEINIIFGQVKKAINPLSKK